MSVHQLIECCEDKQYAKFLNFVKKRESGCFPIYNIGTILNRVPYYSNYEQIFSAGIEDIIETKEKFIYTINDIPKALLRLCKNKKIYLSNRLLNYYKTNPDAHILMYNLEYLSLTDNDLYDIWVTDTYEYDRTTRTGSYYSFFNRLLTDFGYTAKALLLYIDQLKTYEALDDMKFVMRELYDYASMMQKISHKFDKYPRHFLTTHKIACRNYNRLKQEFSEQLFKQRIDKSLELSYGDYCFIYPRNIDEIKQEAVSQNNCVASYIDKVIEGKCHILFLRKKDKPKDSLVTIEVRNNHIVQARRRFNDPVTEEDQEAIDVWNKKFDIKENKAA